MAHIPPHTTRPPIASPIAVIILLVGLTVLGLGIIRSQLGGPAAPARPVAAEQRPASREPGPMRIVVTIPPLYWVAKGLAPEGAEITMLTPVGSGCEGIELTPTQVIAVRRADVTMNVGFGLDDHAVRMGSESPRRLSVSLEDIVTNDERIAAPDPPGHEGHGHAEVNPHVWLDPVIMSRFIESLGDTLATGMIEGLSDREAVGLQRRAAALLTECRRVDTEFRARLGAAARKAIVTQHDAFAYVARRYGLEITAVVQPAHDVEPSPGDMARVTRVMTDRDIKAIFVEPQINSSAAERIADVTGAKVLTLDPLGDGDWPAMMRRNLEALVAGLSNE